MGRLVAGPIRRSRGRRAQRNDRLGPSTTLFDAFKGKKGLTPISFDEYARRYRREMQEPTPHGKIAWLAQSLARGAAVTLLCSSLCTDEARCHRTVLRELLLEEVAQLRR